MLLKKSFVRYSFVQGFLLVLIMGAFTYQVVKWKDFAFPVAILQLKNLVLSLNENDLREMGTICNTMELYSCSEKYFEELVHRFPANENGLANLGFALAHQEKWQRAGIFFERFLRKKIPAFDVYFWYGKTKAQLGQPQVALRWFYKSLSLNPNDPEIVLELIDHLVDMGRYEEALSAVGSFTGGYPEKDPLWKAKISGIEKFAQSQKPHERLKLRLPALIGKTHFLPIKTSGDSDFHFFVVDQREENIIITEGIFSDIYAHHGKALKDNYANLLRKGRLKIPKLRVGPWILENVEVEICQSCFPRVGRSILSKIDLTIEQESETEFLLLSQK